MPSFTFIYVHLHSSTFIYAHVRSFAFIYVHLLLSTWSTVIYVQLPSSNDTLTFIHLHLPLSGFIHINLSSSTFNYVRLPSATFIYRKLPPSTFIYFPVHPCRDVCERRSPQMGHWKTFRKMIISVLLLFCETDQNFAVVMIDCIMGLGVTKKWEFLTNWGVLRIFIFISFGFVSFACFLKLA